MRVRCVLNWKFATHTHMEIYEYLFKHTQYPRTNINDPNTIKKIILSKKYQIFNETNFFYILFLGVDGRPIEYYEALKLIY